ncbi:enoyl-CoA hydratase [alpha proteobacterium U9-1i]|nr:enoyl-CoA hydratase [alpha proteobacterium U9-1i]
MTQVATIQVEDGVGVLTIDSPPVNALGIAVRRGLVEGIEAFAADASVKGIVLICGGRTFFAGADITEFGKPFQEPGLPTVLDAIEGSAKPVVAAIHGTALGGGLEVAMVCHYRVAVPSAKAGLPEVALGLLPGGGGTQRLTRLVGPERALDLITSGRHLNARDALDMGIFDALTEEGQLRRDAIAFVKKVVSEGQPLLRVRDRDDKVAPYRGKPELFAAFRAKNARQFRGFKAPENIIKCIEAAVDLPFDEGMKRERALFFELMTSTESAAQRHAFFAERETSKIPDIAPDTPTLPIKTVGVIGAGTMGGGISMNFLNAGIPVTLVEAKQEALDRGLSVIRKNYEATAKKGRISAADVEKRMSLITPALDLNALANADLIIEAVFESMPIKKEIFAKLDGIARQGAILATNTSYLDVNEIASATKRPEHVLGLHFFSPANVMRLLEIVRGAKTDKAVIATAMKLAKQIGKLPVLSGVCFGFIANRLINPRGRQADRLSQQGTTPQDIDRAIYNYGFAMGPFQMMDLVGLDVIGRDSTERTVRGDLVALGRLGQKQNGGYYDYDEKRNATPSPVAAQIIADFARDHQIVQRAALSEEEIVARLLYPVVNEGAKILEEGIALRGSDVDVAAMMGYNWPVYTGGPMFWADTVGLPKIVAKLKQMQAEDGDQFKPSALLEKLAAEGGKLSRVGAK